MATARIAHPDSSRLAIYPILSRIWAVVFFLVGLQFAVAPEMLGRHLAVLAGWTGLSGAIEAPSGNLWHVLALSLMASITFLAWQSAREPSRPGPYQTLLLAKLVSTAGFAFLAATAGTIWILCAIGDAFVAATLWAAHAADARVR